MTALRELQNLIERPVIRSAGERLDVAQLQGWYW
jgi:hypothetical protein